MCLRLPKLGGSSLSRTTSEENRKNAEIDRLIRKDKKLAAKNVKILLLGLFDFNTLSSRGFRNFICANC